jgi:cytoskeletal protein RodZ
MTPAIGHILRQERISRGLELSDAEQETKIRSKYLDAIEEERWDLLPGEPYNRGFLATYAEFLELDVEALLAEYRRTQGPAEDPTPLPETMLPQRGMARAPVGPRGVVVALILLAAAALGVVAVIGLTGDSGDGGHPARQTSSPKHAGGSRATTTSTTETTATHPARVALELRATDSVWVCLIDDRGHTLVDGETLTADQARGPYKARAYKVTFGNGAIRMTVDDKPVAIPDAGEPLGYRITPNGVSDLSAGAQPTCI